MGWTYQSDHCPHGTRDFVVDGETHLFKEELEDWGARLCVKSFQWILKHSNENCSDYQAIMDLGLSLLPIQESTEEKLLSDQLGKER
tara:strand:- start:9157 stop:9417 length:261 start_codon:yes stop_codon:yes gene_type:complete